MDRYEKGLLFAETMKEVTELVNEFQSTSALIDFLGGVYEDVMYLDLVNEENGFAAVTNPITLGFALGVNYQKKLALIDEQELNKLLG